LFEHDHWNDCAQIDICRLYIFSLLHFPQSETMSYSRRAFLKISAHRTATTAALATFSAPLMAQLGPGGLEPIPHIEDPRIKQLAQRGIDAARAAGAEYADIRLTHTWNRTFAPSGVSDEEHIGVGVRALVKGYWGFASGPTWHQDEMVKLARAAVNQAKINSLGKSRIVDLGFAPVITDKHWEMPVVIDPFEVYPLEICDFLLGLQVFTNRIRYVKGDTIFIQYGVVAQNKAFASTMGTYCTQRTYRSEGKFHTTVVKGQNGGGAIVDILSPAGMGWELFRDQPVRDEMQQAVERVLAEMDLPVKPVDVGLYNATFDAASIASLLNGTVGAATELDRALGYEANSGGTSYLTDPGAMCGTFKLSSPLLSVTANRSEAGGAATVQWDDEGVIPREFPLVKDGVIVDFQTTREGAGWLNEFNIQVPADSRGCAYALSAIDVPLVHTANLQMIPSQSTATFDDLLKTMDKGIAFRGAGFDMDFQQLNGLGIGAAYEVKNGKIVARIAGAGVLMRAPEFWKNLTAIGDQSSVRRYGFKQHKGEPRQGSYHSITAVPGVFEESMIVNDKQDSRILDRKTVEQLLRRAHSFVKGDGETRVSIRSWWGGELRWARNRVSIASDRRDITVSIARKVYGGLGYADTNQIDDVSLQAAVRSAERAAAINGGYSRTRVTNELPTESPILPTPDPKIWSDKTFNVTAEERSALARMLVESAEEASMLSAGYMDMRAFETAHLNTDVDNFDWPKNQIRYDVYTQSQCSTTVRHPKGIGSGWAGISSFDWGAVDSQIIAKRALDKCLASLNPVAIEPGRYTVILEPQAVFSLARFIIQDRQNPEIRGSGPYVLGLDPALNLIRSKLGLKIVDERISISGDPMDPLLGTPPLPGMRPIYWIDKGVLTNLSYNRDYALEHLHENLPAISGGWRMSGGETSIDEMISTTKRGLLVTRFSNTRTLDYDSLLIGGLTRDGLWLVENGKISKAVKNMRFVESPLFVFNQVEQIGVPVPIFFPDTPVIVPPIKARDFSFTSMIDAV
jgi:TldD protein